MSAKNLLQQVISKNQPISFTQYQEVLRDSILYYDEQYEQARQTLLTISFKSSAGRNKRRGFESLADIAMSKKDAYATALKLCEQLVMAADAAADDVKVALAQGLINDLAHKWSK